MGSIKSRPKPGIMVAGFARGTFARSPIRGVLSQGLGCGEKGGASGGATAGVECEETPKAISLGTEGAKRRSFPRGASGCLYSVLSRGRECRTTEGLSCP
jgi:hypothetical protein